MNRHFMQPEDFREERIETLEGESANASKRAAAMKLTSFLRGAVAVGLVAALVAGQTIWNLETQRGEEVAHDAETVDLAGRQRMLSQRMALLAHDADPSSGLDAVRGVYEKMRADAERIKPFRGLWGHQLPALETAELARVSSFGANWTCSCWPRGRTAPPAASPVPIR